MNRSKELMPLIFLSAALALWALAARYIDNPLGMAVFATVVLVLAYSRQAHPLKIPGNLGAILSLIAVVFLLAWVSWLGMPPGPGLTYFLTAFILVRSLSLRSFRHCAQLMGLSLLGMVAAGAYNFRNAEIYSVLALAYLIVAGYTASKAHFIHEILAHQQFNRQNQAATIVQGQPTNYIRPYLRTGMLTLVIGMLIFWMIPRRTFSLSMNPLTRSGETRTGFTATMTLGEMSRLTEDTDPALRVKALGGEQAAGLSSTLYLRGAALTHYRHENGDWQWGIPHASDAGTPYSVQSPANFERIQQATTDASRQTIWRISYQQPSAAFLFLIDRPLAIRANDVRLLFSPELNTLRMTTSSPKKGFTYDLLAERTVAPPTSKKQTKPTTQPAKQKPKPKAKPRPGRKAKWYARPWWRRSIPYPVSKAKSPDFVALRKETLKLLGKDYKKLNELDVARKIEQHLRTQFTYSFDNTDVNLNVEPVYDFLTRRKHGHCEYFSSAMALMCQSVGIEARVVTGYMGGVYNTFGGYYLFRNCDAHAWTEVAQKENQWTHFDPTPASRNTMLQKNTSETFKFFWDMIDLVRFSWITRISKYDGDHREKIIERVQERLANDDDDGNMSAPRLKLIVSKIIEFFRGEEYGSSLYQLLHWFIGLLALIILLLTLRIGFGLSKHTIRQLKHYIANQWHERFGNLWACPIDFYRKALLDLARHGMVKGDCETPREFAEALRTRPENIYPELASLTEVYMQVRFGGKKLNRMENQHMMDLAGRLHGKLTLIAKTKRPAA